MERPSHVVWLILLVLVLVLAVALVLTRPAAAERWQLDLAEQIASEQDCEVAFLSHVIERDIDGRQMVLAKVHCEDQRAFDAVRFDEYDPFEIKPCEDQDVIGC